MQGPAALVNFLRALWPDKPHGIPDRVKTSTTAVSVSVKELQVYLDSWDVGVFPYPYPTQVVCPLDNLTKMWDQDRKCPEMFEPAKVLIRQAK